MRHALLATGVAAALALTGLASSLGHPEDAAAAGRTSPDWARLADRVLTPALHWATCQLTAQCATAGLPLDYQDPHGATIRLGSRLVRSDSWGHQALTTSACVGNTTWDYLIDPQAPAPKITYCRGDVQPFATAPATAGIDTIGTGAMPSPA